jgi:simple sugar transport system substrate-binding protein
MTERRPKALRLLLAVAAVVAALFIAACGDDDDGTETAAGTSGGDIDIAFVSHGQAADPFHSIIKKGAEAAADETGVSLRWQGLEKFDIAQMVQNIEAAIATNPDGLIVSYPDPDAIGPKIDEAVEKGIPVVVADWATSDDPVADHGALAYVGSNEQVAGEEGGARLREAGVTHALCVNPEVGNVVLDVRCDGVTKGLGGKVDVLGVDLNDPTAVQKSIEGALSEDPDIDGIITLWAPGSEQALAAVEATGKEDEVTLATFDLSPEAAAAVADGRILFAIDQQPWIRGYLPVLSLAKFNELGVTAVGPVPTGPMFITEQNADQVVELAEQGLR